MIIDSDYFENPGNDGEIFIQAINLSPFAIQLKKGDRIAQGIVHTFGMIEGAAAGQDRIGGLGSTT